VRNIRRSEDLTLPISAGKAKNGMACGHCRRHSDAIEVYRLSHLAANLASGCSVSFRQACVVRNLCWMLWDRILILLLVRQPFGFRANVFASATKANQTEPLSDP
jgi:hypothetical protein